MTANKKRLERKEDKPPPPALLQILVICKGVCTGRDCSAVLTGIVSHEGKRMAKDLAARLR